MRLLLRASQKQSMTNKRHSFPIWFGITVLIVLALLFCPYKSTTAPQWRLEVVDENGKPISGLQVLEEWEYFDLDVAPWMDYRYTDNRGQVVFPRRVTWASLATRILMVIDTHGSFVGPSLFFQACDDRSLHEGKLFWDGNRFWYRGPRQKDSRIVATPVQLCGEI
jgi:hypothetical protein